ncbi:NAD-dependent epimerase/dehydratase family protein [Acaryochloris sp. IP29b_bin.148]|uniref:NAD-dependent epimerase/dehydratase family protein n=1 Tax=Acaryochloris sp. IP29b_bin.148 TaxID=2969218 RepID=UPI002613F0ED|nr:NAD-dependent epimerase/dehydratase family protein [Acaryochloris sp. IP29b_bin.148]
MRVFIIGGTGYIGTSTVRVLQNRGHLTTALIRDEKRSSQLQSTGAKTLLGDLANPETLTTAIQASDALVYTAAGQSEAYAQVEEKVIKHILTILEGSDKTFVKITGSMVFGDTGPNGFSETATFNPPPPLAGAAALSETIRVAANRGIKTVQIFPSYVYGRNGGDIPSIMLRVAKQEGKGIYVADGKAMWSTVHVDDVGQLIALAVEKASAGSILFPATSAMTIKEISQDIADAAGLDQAIGLTMEEAQNKLGFFAIPLTLNQVFSDQAASQLGWQPHELSLSESLKHDHQI